MGKESLLIPLTKGFETLIDSEDAVRILQYKWTASIESNGSKVYAIRWETRDGKRIKIRMHRFVLNLPPGPSGPVVDHLNGDSLDNRKCNLEVISQELNMKRANHWKREKKEEPVL